MAPTWPASEALGLGGTTRLRPSEPMPLQPDDILSIARYAFLVQAVPPATSGAAGARKRARCVSDVIDDVVDERLQYEQEREEEDACSMKVHVDEESE